MSVIFSRQCEYALQAILYLALKPDGAMTSIKELTKKLDIPYHFLAKILQNLANKRLLVSQRGLKGGFALARPTSGITLYQVVEAIDGLDFLTNCVLGFPDCSSKHPCAVHYQWEDLRKEIHTMLISKSIDDFAKETLKAGYNTA